MNELFGEFVMRTVQLCLASPVVFTCIVYVPFSLKCFEKLKKVKKKT